MTYVRTKAAGTHHHGVTLILTKGTRQAEQLQGLIKGDGLNGLALLHLSETGFVIILGAANLNDGTVTAYLYCQD